MRKTGVSVVLMFLALGLLAYASAAESGNVLFLGKVYGEHFGSSYELGSVDVKVRCGDVVKSVKSSSIKDNLGSYVISFSADACSENSSISFEISKSGYKKGSFSKYYDGTNLSRPSFVLVGGDKVLVVNFVMEKENSNQGSHSGSSGGSSGGGSGGDCKSVFWECSNNWSECSNGVQTRECVSNCRDIRTETRSCNESASKKNGGLEFNATGAVGEKKEETEKSGVLSSITGAFAGPTGKKKLTVVILILLAIIGFYGLLRSKEEEVEEGKNEEQTDVKKTEENKEEKTVEKKEKVEKKTAEKKE